MTQQTTVSERGDSGPKPIGGVLAKITAQLDAQSDADDDAIARERSAYEAEIEQRRRRGIASAVFRNSERYKPCTLENFACETDPQREVVSKIRAHLDALPDSVKAGAGVLLCGPVGTGKDHLLAAMMKEAILRWGFQVVWRNGMDWFGDVRDAMDTETRERTVISELAEPKILAISDPIPPIGGLTPHQSSMLLRVIDGRYRRALPTWVTMNAANRAEAEKLLGAQHVDRLGHNALVLFCGWSSYRRKART